MPTNFKSQSTETEDAESKRCAFVTKEILTTAIPEIEEWKKTFSNAQADAAAKQELPIQAENTFVCLQEALKNSQFSKTNFNLQALFMKIKQYVEQSSPAPSDPFNQLIAAASRDYWAGID